MHHVDLLTGAEVRAFRDQHELTQAELAELIGGSKRGVEDWEANRRQPPAMLRLAFAAVSRKVAPWREVAPLRPGASMDDVRASAERRFADLGDRHAEAIADEWQSCLSPQGTPAEALLLAQLFDMSDGYNTVQVVEDWNARPKKGWHTSIGHRPNLEVAAPSFAVECRYDDAHRQIAIFVDAIRPGERLPRKVQVETALIARGIRVLVFSETDVLVDPEAVRETVETVIDEVTDEVLVAAGHIAKAWVSPSRRADAEKLENL